MSTVFTVPTTPTPQKFNCSLNGTSYQLLIKWNTAANCWELDLADNTGNPLIEGIPLITGADLLEQFAYVGIGAPGAQMIVQSDNNPDLVPSFTTLGVTGQLYYVSPL